MLIPISRCCHKILLPTTIHAFYAQTKVTGFIMEECVKLQTTCTKDAQKMKPVTF